MIGGRIHVLVCAALDQMGNIGAGLNMILMGGTEIIYGLSTGGCVMTSQSSNLQWKITS